MKDFLDMKVEGLFVLGVFGIFLGGVVFIWAFKVFGLFSLFANQWLSGLPGLSHLIHLLEMILGS